MKEAGILLPLASLPSKFGCGDFGKTAYEFIDAAVAAGFKLWQILPLNPLGYGNSPYQALASEALDELYISLEALKDVGLIHSYQAFRPHAKRIAYSEVREFKEKYLRAAFKNFKPDSAYLNFIQANWVYDYAVFRALKQKNNLKAWMNWPKADKEWIKKCNDNPAVNADEIAYQMFLQYILFNQWRKLQAYAREKGLKLVGDLPFYVGVDSLDVWRYQEGFLLDAEGNPRFVAGVPPDYFSQDGQRWGNPIYNWEQLRKDHFTFWLKRFYYAASLYDIVRIDHFRAFDTYWQIPASSPNAKCGEWLEAPGYELFDTLYAAYPQLKIVAEDLGDLRPEVHKLRDHYNLAGMRILQYSFNPLETKKADSRTNLLFYTGTHDNAGLKAWYQSRSSEFKKASKVFFKQEGINNPHIIDNFIEYTLRSEARYALISIIDCLALNEHARINHPGTLGSPNWEFKLKDLDAFKAKTAWFKDLLVKTKRA